MKIQEILKKIPLWLSQPNNSSSPNENSIAVASRARLARNITNKEFPGWAKPSTRDEIRQLIVPNLNKIKIFDGFYSENLENLNKIEKQILVEKHLISRELAVKNSGSAFIINKDQSISIMINEEDHLRMQVILPGLQLDKSFDILNNIDNEIDQKLTYAFDSTKGYLTACPTNLGTGLRISVMLHLPALVISEQINHVIKAANSLGLAVRGLYGEGTEALANFFQISNQTTLGETEENINKHIKKYVNTIIKHEEKARQVLVQSKFNLLKDQISRAYGTLKYAYAISTKEALNCLSMLRLGTELNYLNSNFNNELQNFFINIQPAHIQSNNDVDSENRDSIRAKLTREFMQNIKEPKYNNYRINNNLNNSPEIINENNNPLNDE